MSYHFFAMFLGFVLDLLFGDPHWLPHPIRLIGNLIASLEKLNKKELSDTKKFLRGFAMVVIVITWTTGVTAVILEGAYGLHPAIGCAVEAIMTYQILATKCLKVESMKVYEQLQKQKDFAPGDSLVVKEYINNMPELLAAADLVISRAGALTLAELEAVGRAAVLIPSPNVAENHQFHNAMALVNRGAAEIIEEKDLTGPALWEKVRSILSDPERLRSLGENAGKMEILDANDRIYRVIKSAAGQ